MATSLDSLAQRILGDLLRPTSAFDSALVDAAGDSDEKVLIAHYLVKHGRGAELYRMVDAGELQSLVTDLADFACFCALRNRSRASLMAVRYLDLPHDRLAAVCLIDAALTFSEGRPARALRLAAYGEKLAPQGGKIKQIILHSAQVGPGQEFRRGSKIRLIPSDNKEVRLF